MISGLDNFGRKHGEEGQRITLTCTVKSGQPEETMLWVFNGTVVKVGGPRILRFDWIATRSDNLLNYTCMANNSATSEPLKKTVQLDIAYTPFLSVNGSKEIKSFEGQPLYITCDQISNPPSSEPNWWTVDDSGIYICEASNTMGTGSTNISINVLYPPSVRIDYNNYTENENRKELLCVANGNPDTYTFSRWEHKSEYGEYIRFIDGYTNGSLVLPTTQTKSYQDSGFYVCTVSNGVPDTHGQVNQSTDAFLSVRGKPVFVESNKKIFYGIVDEPTYIRFEVYSVPKVTEIQLKDINGVLLNRKTETAITNEPAMLRLRFHNTLVKSNGYQLKIHFSTFSEKDVGKYTMGIENRYGKATINFTIQAASPPSIPINFSVTPLVNDVFVNWLKNFDGGLEQTFFIEYQVEGNINWISVKSLNSSASAELSWQISGLLSTQTYFFRMFARNALGESNKTAIRIIQMKGKEKGMFTIFAVISSTGVVFIILLPAVICICIRNRCSGEVSGNRPRTITTDGPSIYDEIPSDHIPENFVPTYTNEPNDESGPRIRVERQLETNSDVYISESEVYQVNDDYLEPWVKNIISIRFMWIWD
ncbi:unnamed protein product [Mytilus edulis]|uniref:Uncharacterized protein n=1 Tax=Mytilus edulis TaxID=6550 RepID=A0A8S3QQN8_MYTED|nr:unnamed protein product [Mytilus edulis]